MPFTPEQASQIVEKADQDEVDRLAETIDAKLQSEYDGAPITISFDENVHPRIQSRIGTLYGHCGWDVKWGGGCQRDVGHHVTLFKHESQFPDR